MNLTLVIAILFTIAAIASTFSRKSRYWWALSLLLSAAAIINWLRYFEVM